MKRRARSNRTTVASREKRRRLVAPILIGAVSALVCSAIIVLVTIPVTPSILSVAAPLEEVPVREQLFADLTAVDVVVEQEPDTVLASPVAGRVTRSECRDGAIIASGGTFISIDGRPLLTLATATPLWRDLRVGDTGDDVADLQAEVARLGGDVIADGTIGSATLEALDRLFTSVGDTSGPQAIVQSSRILWTPAGGATIARCTLSLGSVVSPGEGIARLPGRVDAARILHMPDVAVEGERVVRIGGQDFDVLSDGGLVDPSAIAVAPSSVADVDGAGGDTAFRTIAAHYALRAAQPVSVAPPSAVYAISDRLGCVESRGRAYPVRIVGSQLGQTYVVFETTDTPRTVSARPKAKIPCR